MPWTIIGVLLIIGLAFYFLKKSPTANTISKLTNNVDPDDEEEEEEFDNPYGWNPEDDIIRKPPQDDSGNEIPF